jgi:hypothetical protein
MCINKIKVHVHYLTSRVAQQHTNLSHGRTDVPAFSGVLGAIPPEPPQPPAASAASKPLATRAPPCLAPTAVRPPSPPPVHHTLLR